MGIGFDNMEANFRVVMVKRIKKKHRCSNAAAVAIFDRA